MRYLAYLSVAVLALGACNTGDGSDDQDFPTARERLTAGLSMMNVLPDNSSVSLRLSYGSEVDSVTFDAPYGFLGLSANVAGDLRVDSVDIVLGDVALGNKGLPPTGLSLRDLRLHSEERHPCDAVQWGEGADSCEASANVSMVLEGDMHVTDGLWVPWQIPLDSNMDIFVYRGAYTSLGGAIQAIGSGSVKDTVPMAVTRFGLDLELEEALLTDE